MQTPLEVDFQGMARTRLYEVNIRLALPNGREVNVGRTRRRTSCIPI
jgi:hypothetical protein